MVRSSFGAEGPTRALMLRERVGLCPSLGAGLHRVDSLGNGQLGVSHRAQPIVDREDLGLAELAFELRHTPRELVQWHGIGIWPNLQEVDGDVRNQPHNQTTLVIKHLLGSCFRALTDQDNSSGAYGPVDGILSLRAHGYWHFACGPATSQRAFKYGSDGTGLTLNLGVRCFLRSATEHDKEHQESTEDTGDNPQGETEWGVAR